jgi:hypothetical protein
MVLTAMAQHPLNHVPATVAVSGIHPMCIELLVRRGNVCLVQSDAYISRLAQGAGNQVDARCTWGVAQGVVEVIGADGEDRYWRHDALVAQGPRAPPYDDGKPGSHDLLVIAPTTTMNRWTMGRAMAPVWAVTVESDSDTAIQAD